MFTAELKYIAHQLDINESDRTATIMDRMTWKPVAKLTDCEWSSQDRTRYRVEGLDPDGNRAIWAATTVCGRCAGSPMVLPTASYEIPT